MGNTVEWFTFATWRHYFAQLMKMKLQLRWEQNAAGMCQ